MAEGSIRDVVEAVELMSERQDASGAPWCLPKDAAAVRNWVVDRTAALGGGLRQVVRLAAAMAAAQNGDYAKFLYVRLKVLRGRLFQAEFAAAAPTGTLRDGIVVTGSGIVVPAASDGSDEAFDIQFGQMPRLAALLDVIHNALGFVEVAKLLEPVTRSRGQRGSYVAVARALHAALNAWLAERLQSANHLRQAHAMRTFLALRGRADGDAITNDAILQFWVSINATNDNDIEGFRLFKSAAGSMLRYREALRDASHEQALEKTLAGAHAGDEHMLDYAQAVEVDDAWRSPLAHLAEVSGARVKWLTQKEIDQLRNYTGAAAPTADDAEEAARGLMGDTRFDLAFWPTLFRVDVFGDAQASIVGRMRKRHPGAEATAQALAGITPAAYADTHAAYAALRDQVHLELLAVLAHLVDAGAWEALLLVRHLGGTEALAEVQAHIDLEAADDPEALAATVGAHLQEAAADPASALGRLLKEARSAQRKVARAGLRREDLADPEILRVVRASCQPAVALLLELDRLLAGVRGKLDRVSVGADLAIFAPAFQRMYGTPTAA